MPLTALSDDGSEFTNSATDFAVLCAKRQKMTHPMGGPLSDEFKSAIFDAV
jgi:hypothetical protein